MGKNILMICYYYPPLTDVGCKRSVAFSTYFRKFGWNPYVISVKNPDRTYCVVGNDEPPEGVEVTYSYSLFNMYKFFGKLNGLLARTLKIFGIRHEKNYFYDIFCIPDFFIGWVPLAYIKGLKLIKKHNINAIYLSCSPFSSGIIGKWLKDTTGKPLIIDYRDPFGLDITEYQENAKQVRFRKSIDKWIVGRILQSCDVFTVTTEETKQLYIDQFPFVKNKIHTIYNGFDHAFLDKLNEQEKFPKFTIIYTGNFYYDVRFDYFFEGIGFLKKMGKIDESNFQFLFYGGHKELIQHVSEKYGVTDLVDIKKRIPFQDILIQIKKSHLQLLRIKQPMISTKLFEGLALNIPFLATVPPGEVEHIIQQFSPSSFIVTDESPQSVAKNIENAIYAYNNGQIKSNAVSEFLEDFSRENLSREMIRLIEEISL